MRVLVTGASGLLGLNLCFLKHSEVDIIGVIHHNTLSSAPFQTVRTDLLEEGRIDTLIDQIKPELVINCAALASIDVCERQPELAFRMNAELPGAIAASCNRHSIKLVHFSTDAVFDGISGGYREEDTTNPLSVYARTKLEGELNVLGILGRVLIPRVNFYGHSLDGKRSLAEFFLYHLQQKKRMKGFMDVIFCPLYAADLVDILFRMIQLDLMGIYHVVSNEALSKYEFGIRLAERFGLEKDLVHAAKVDETGLLAKRSHHLTLNVEKLIAAGITPPDQASGIDQFFNAYNNGYAQTLRKLNKKINEKYC
jgi:dTDP-4-dehydrorhamnose reductase